MFDIFLNKIEKLRNSEILYFLCDWMIVCVVSVQSVAASFIKSDQNFVFTISSTFASSILIFLRKILYCFNCN